jgi:hypothetical protein
MLAEESGAAVMVQALWRRKSGLKKATAQKEATLDGKERVLIAKRATRNSQVSATLLVMLAVGVTTLLPNYIIGATYGAVADGEGIGAIYTNIGIRYGVFEALAIFMQMELFSYAMRDTAFIPGTTERIVRPLLFGWLGHFLFNSNFWMAVDLQNPEKSITLFEGVPGAVLGLVGSTLFLDAKAQPVEMWRLYRSRNVKLPPAHAATWWELTTAAGRGTLAAMLAWSATVYFLIGYAGIYLAISSFFDKAATIEAAVGDGSILEIWIIKYYFVIVLPFMLLAVLWAKPWPPAARDPVSAVVLSLVQEGALYQGSFTAFNLYSWLGGPDGSVLGCQIAIEVLMLLLYLYARTRARRAFGASPTHEARALSMYLLLSDGARAVIGSEYQLHTTFIRSHCPLGLSDCWLFAAFAELAFVNTPFAGGQFWALVFVDFVMLLMRDVSLSPQIQPFIPVPDTWCLA